jgi:hypothetical protein
LITIGGEMEATFSETEYPIEVPGKPDTEAKFFRSGMSAKVCIGFEF